MEPAAMNMTAVCQHSHHLFKSPLCSNLTTQQKVGNIFFHIFTFGLPLAFYKIYVAVKRSQIKPPSIQVVEQTSQRPSFTQNAVASVQLVNSHRNSQETVEQNLDEVNDQAISSPDPIDTQEKFFVPACTSRGQEAIDFAYNLLAKENVEPFQLDPKYKPPVNDKILKIFTLFYSRAAQLKELLKLHSNDPWSDPEVIQVADQALNLGFAAGYLGLKDAKDLIEGMGVDRSPAQALTNQDTYLFKAFFMVQATYHFTRGAGYWRPEENNLGLPQSTPQSHMQKFYTSGTNQNEWKQLYNEFCNIVAQFAGVEDLQASDPRFYQWIQPDVSPKFVPYPSPIP